MNSRFSILPKNVVIRLIELTLIEQLSVGLRCNCVFVFLILLRWSSNGLCRNRSITLLARDSKVSRPTVINSLNILKEHGIITYSSQRGGNTDYILNGLNEHNVTKIPYRFSSRNVIEELQSKNSNKLLSITIYLVLTMFYNKEEEWVAMCGFNKISEITNINNTNGAITKALKILIDANLIIKKMNSIYKIVTNEN